MNFLTRKERNRLVYRIKSMDWGDEDDVFNFAVDMCYLSVKLRGEIIRRSEYDD